MCHFFDKRGYPASVVQAGHHRAQQIDLQSALHTSQKENNNRIPFTLTFHPQIHAVKSIIVKNFKLLQNDPDTGRIFSQPPLISFKRDKNIGNFLVRSAFQTSNRPGTFKCARARCKTCPFICNVKKLSGPKRSIKITDHFTCTSTNVIYCITCTLCKKLYIGETGRRLGDRFREHLRDVEEDDKNASKPVAWHFNPLTPVPPVTARDEPWPFFLFRRHHFWPKLASFILNFCRRKRSFQWCPDQSDRPKGALDMRKNAQKVEWKTRGKISCDYTWMLHAKNCPSRWRFLRSFLTASKPCRRSITAAKTREKEKKERRKKIPKIEKPKDVGHFLLKSFYFCACPSHNALKRDAGGKKGKPLSCKRIFDWIKGNLAQIQPKNHQNVQKIALFAKSSRSQWVNLPNHSFIFLELYLFIYTR